MSDALNTDLLLIEACLKGDAKAQKELYEQYARKMMPICLRYSNDYETARDLLHDGFVRVFTYLCNYKGEGSFEGWMRKIFVNTALEYLRKLRDKPHQMSIEDACLSESNDYSVLETMSESEIINCIQELPPMYRSVFNMFVIEGYSHKEIGALLNITASSSRVYLTRAKQMMQAMLIKRYGKNERFRI